MLNQGAELGGRISSHECIYMHSAEFWKGAQPLIGACTVAQPPTSFRDEKDAKRGRGDKSLNASLPSSIEVFWV